MSSPTEEEINNMKSELEKYGIQMPAFSKIGGILANELSVDEAACEWGSDIMGRGWDVIAANDVVKLINASIIKLILISSNLWRSQNSATKVFKHYIYLQLCFCYIVTFIISQIKDKKDSFICKSFP